MLVVCVYVSLCVYASNSYTCVCACRALSMPFLFTVPESLTSFNLRVRYLFLFSVFGSSHRSLFRSICARLFSSPAACLFTRSTDVFIFSTCVLAYIYISDSILTFLGGDRAVLCDAVAECAAGMFRIGRTILWYFSHNPYGSQGMLHAAATQSL